MFQEYGDLPYVGVGSHSKIKKTHLFIFSGNYAPTYLHFIHLSQKVRDI